MEEIAKNSPAGIILREKDLSEQEYRSLSQKVIKICEQYHITCILHSFAKIAIELNAKAIHLTLPQLKQMSDTEKNQFKMIGASCHSVEEAVKAEQMGCSYIIAGHIFATDCKKGVPPRGIAFLENVCKAVSIPVFAIGGINSQNIDSVRNAGAKGACIMSGLMCCKDVQSYLKDLK